MSKHVLADKEAVRCEERERKNASLICVFRHASVVIKRTIETFLHFLHYWQSRSTNPLGFSDSQKTSQHLVRAIVSRAGPCQSILGQLAQNTLSRPVPFPGVEDETLPVFGARTGTRGQAVRLRRRHCTRAAAAKQGEMQQRAPPTTGSEHGNVT